MSEEILNLEAEKITDNKENLEKVLEHVFPSLIEMGQLKTNMDMLLFSAGHEGCKPEQFLACKFHYICRQLFLCLSESKRMDIELRENEMRIKDLGNKKSKQYKLCVAQGNYPSIEKEKLEKRQWELKINLKQKASMTVMYTKIHDALIAMNDGKVFTNEEFQKQQPEYYNWYIANKIYIEACASQTGISKGVIEAHNKLTQQPLLEGYVKPIDPIIRVADFGAGQPIQFFFNQSRVAQIGEGDQLKLSKNEMLLVIETKKAMDMCGGDTSKLPKEQVELLHNLQNKLKIEQKQQPQV